MTTTTFTLHAETENDEYSYSVSLEDSYRGLARLNVKCLAAGQNEYQPTNSQGVDLTAEECEALGQQFLAMAVRLFRERHADA